GGAVRTQAGAAVLLFAGYSLGGLGAANLLWIGRRPARCSSRFGWSMTALRASPHANTSPGPAEGGRPHVSPSLLRLARGLFAATTDCIVLLNVHKDGQIVCEGLNPAAERVLARDAAECVGRPVRG